MIDENSWNPLDFTGKQEQYKAIAISSTKQQIRNILKSYVGYFDPLCELLQNAMDATDKRVETLSETNYSRSIAILLNLQENTIYICDNGIGFSHLSFRTFLCPNVSFKTSGKSRGNKGVGATYLAYGFSKLELYTKTPEIEQYAKIESGYDWIYNQEDNSEAPLVIPLHGVDPEFRFDRGSSFKLYLTNTNGQKIKDLTWLGLDTAQAWSYVLLLNTPLGHLSVDSTQSNVKFDITVIAADGSKTVLNDQCAEYYYPHKFLNNYALDIDTVLKWQDGETAKSRSAYPVPMKFKQKLAIYRFYGTQEIMKLSQRSRTLTEEELVNLGKFNISAYGFFCNSVDRWVDINEKYIGARKNSKCISYGLQMATNNMIQGDTIQIPLTSNIGYQKQSQVIVHLVNAEPDLGRKGFQPELRILAEKISAMIISVGLSSWRELLSADGHHDKRDGEIQKLHEYIKSIEKHEEDKPLRIDNEAFFLPTKRVSVSCPPMTEQDVIVLFNQIIAGGVVRSLELLATSSIAQYDGVYRFRMNAPLENHYYDEATNPLGIERQSQLSPGIKSAPAVLEYKYSFDSLIQDFDNEDKSPNDIGLVVVWTMGNQKWRERYQAISYLMPDYRSQRPYHGVTHVLLDSMKGNQRAFFCIVLEELIYYLNDPSGYTETYSSIYSEI